MRLNIILAVLGLFFFSSSFAQSVSHKVSVSIPNVLRLKIDQQDSDQGKVAVQIVVRNGSYDITPANTSIEVFANSDWQLSASYQPEAGSEDVALSYLLDGREEAFSSYPSVIRSGEVTKGWQAVNLEYGLKSLPADGIYGGTVTYTLARP